MDKNIYDSGKNLWISNVGVTVGNAEPKEEKRVYRQVPAEKEESHQYHYQYLYIEDEEDRDRK